MATSAARRDGIDDEQRLAHPGMGKRERHLHAVPDEFANTTAAASGSSLDIVLATLALTSVLWTHPDADHTLDLAQWLAEARTGSGEAREMLRVAETLAGNFGAVADQLRALDGTEVPSSDMRTHWAQNLERVRDGGELLYVTHHGERVAALVPSHVADYYRDAEDKADAEAIDRAQADRDAGEQPVAFEELAEELSL